MSQLFRFCQSYHFHFLSTSSLNSQRGSSSIVWLDLRNKFPHSFHEFQITELKLLTKLKSHTNFVLEENSVIICKQVKREPTWSLLHYGAFFAMPSSSSGKEENRGLRSFHEMYMWRVSIYLGIICFAF